MCLLKPSRSSGRPLPRTYSSSLDLAPDGRRFAVLSQPYPGGEQKRSVHVNFLMNFFDDVRRRIPSDNTD